MYQTTKPYKPRPKKLFVQKLDALTEQITQALKLQHDKVSVQKAWFGKFFAGYEVGICDDSDREFTLYYYPEAREDIVSFMGTHRGARYHGYKLVEICSVTDFVDIDLTGTI